MRTLGCDGPNAARTPIHKWVPGFNPTGELYETTSQEWFVGNVTGTVQTQQGYATISSGGYTNAAVIPGATDQGTVGVLRSTLTSTAAGGVGGLTRSQVPILGNNCFGGNRQFAWVMRLRPVTAMPDAGEDYFAAGGLYCQEAATVQANNGIYWYFDKALGFWNLRAARGGARAQRDSTLVWDLVDYHWLGFLVNADGLSVVPYVDGIALAPIISANVQPLGTTMASIVAHIRAIGATTISHIMDTDHVEWGWAEP